MMKSHYAIPPKNALSIDKIIDKSPRRKVISENLKWDKDLVPRLRNLCINAAIDNITIINDLEKLDENDRKEIIDKLPLDLPLGFLLSSIPDEDLWERKFKEKWKKCRNIIKFRSWRDAFLEHYLMDKIDTYETTHGGFRIDESILPHLTASVQHLEIKEIYPSMKPEPELEENDEQMSVEYWPIDLSRLLRLLPNIVRLSVSFCILRANSSSFRYTGDDYGRLIDGIKNYRYMQYLQVHRSSLTDDDLQLLIVRLQQLPSLKELDFSHNLLRENGIKELMEFLAEQKEITKVNLCNNYLGNAGAIHIAEMLSSTAIAELNIRFCRIADEGAQKLFRSIKNNDRLVALNISSNNITQDSASELALLVKNPFLKSVDISGNDIGGDGMQQLQQELSSNMTLVECEVRFTGCSPEMEQDIKEKIAANQRKNGLLGARRNIWKLS